MDNHEKISCLKDEYFLLQNFYESFDQRLLTIKGWSATIGLAAIGVGFYQSHYLWLFAAGASLVFWLLEAMWKSYQYMHAYRISELEEAFRTERFDSIKPLQIYSSWFEAYRKYGLRVLSNFSLLGVSFPHAITFVIGAMLFIFQSIGMQLVQNP